MKYFRPLYPFLLGLVFILGTSTFYELALLNSLAQIVLFTLVVCIPIWRTGRMSYVDIGWPWGLVLMGAITLCFSEGYWIRSLIVSTVMILIGFAHGLRCFENVANGFAKEGVSALSISTHTLGKRG